MSPGRYGLSRNFWAGRRVLVTGHTGFKGSWLALWLERLGADVTGLALPPATDDAAFTTMSPWPMLKSRLGDLRDPAALSAVVDADPEVVFHLAAQSLVRRGYADPSGTYSTNVLGTVQLLQALQSSPSLRAVVVVTTDKVYANSGDGRCFSEADPLGGHDPYSNSKACVELVVDAWRHSFVAGRPYAIATARAGNVVGGGDSGDDRLLPDIRRSLHGGAPLRLRYPRAVRPWLFVLEPLAGYLQLAERLVTEPTAAPAAVNFGPDPASCWPVAQVVERVFALCGAGAWEPDPGEQPPEAPALRLDASLARAALGWEPVLDLETSLRWTVDWWRRQADEDDLRQLAVDQIESYERLAQAV